MELRFVHTPVHLHACRACGLALHLRGVLDISQANHAVADPPTEVELRVKCAGCQFVNELTFPVSRAKPWRPPPDPFLDRLTSGASASAHNHPNRSATETARFMVRFWQHALDALIRADRKAQGRRHD